MARGTTRLTINLTDELADQMRARADALGITMTELVRRGVSLEYLLFGRESGVDVVLRERETGREREIVPVL